jgi:hypothetical protein
MGRRKEHKINIREERLESLSTEKFEVALWLLAKGKVEDRTQRAQPAPPREAGKSTPTGRVKNRKRPGGREVA